MVIGTIFGLTRDLKLKSELSTQELEKVFTENYIMIAQTSSGAVVHHGDSHSVVNCYPNLVTSSVLRPINPAEFTTRKPIYIFYKTCPDFNFGEW